MIMQLPHLQRTMISEAFGYNLCSYALSLEAWRRGLLVTFWGSSKNRFSVSNKQIEIYFDKSRPEISESTTMICRKKELTLQYMLDANLSVPVGRLFNRNVSIDEMLSFIDVIGYPIVIKPSDLSLGKGVLTHIIDQETAINHIIEIRDNYKISDILIEEHIYGDDLRVFVVGDEAVAATKRIPANVKGDGINSIEQLIELKNITKSENPYENNALIRLDHEIEKNIADAGYQLQDILKADETLFLRKKANISAGGDSFDYTDDLSDKIKEVAVQAIKAIPGLTQGGIDIIVDSQNQSQYKIIEINGRAQLGMHLFPSNGLPRDVPKSIIDYYFPDSIPQNQLNRNIYYNFREVFDSMKKSNIREYVVKPIEYSMEIMKKYTVHYTNIDAEDEKKEICMRANKLNLSGIVKITEEKTMSIIVYGNKLQMDLFKHHLLDENVLNNFNVISESQYIGSIKRGIFAVDEWSIDSKIKYALKSRKNTTPQSNTLNVIMHEAKVRGFTTKIKKSKTTSGAAEALHVSTNVEFYDSGNCSFDDISQQSLICNKIELYAYLNQYGRNWNPELEFDNPDIDNVNQFIKKNGYPIVISSVDKSFSQGRLLINNADDLIRTWNENIINWDKFAIWRYIDGSKYQFICVFGIVRSIIKIIPAYVIGDGSKTVQELINEKNILRAKTPIYPLIEIDGDLDIVLNTQNFTVRSIPAFNTYIYLRSDATIINGGESIECTDIVHHSYIDLIEKIATAFNGIVFTGWTVTISDINNTATRDNWALCDITNKPELSYHYWPCSGDRRNVALEALDKLIYDIPVKFINAHSYFVSISGNVQNTGFRKWIKTKASEYTISGWIRNCTDGTLEAEFSGCNVESILPMCYIGPLKAIVDNISITKIPVKNYDGFRILKKAEPQNLASKAILQLENMKNELFVLNKEKQAEIVKLTTDINRLHSSMKAKENKITEHEVNYRNLRNKLENEEDRTILYKNKYYKIRNSRIWRYTKPIRKIFSILKLK